MVSRVLTLAVTSVLVAGCAVGPDYRSAAPTEMSLLNSQAAGTVQDTPVAQWWRQFEDPVLERLVAEALLANPDLRMAVTRVQAARAVFREGKLEVLPHVQVVADQQRVRATDAQGGGVEQAFSLGLDVAWELDLFGRLRRGAEAARADLEVERASLEDLQVLVAAEVARHYFQLRGTQKQLGVAERTLENLDQTQRLTETRQQLGAGNAIDVYSSRARLKQIQAEIPLLRVEEARGRYRLAVLLGLPPGRVDAQLAPREVAAYSRALPLGDTRQLLRNRADVRAAERRLAAATARVGIATADLFPRISVAGFAGFLAGDVSALVGSGQRGWSVAPSIRWAGFDLGSVRARLRVAEADADGEAIAYEKVVLTALEEAETALQAYAGSQERLRVVIEQAQAAREAERLARLGYEAGSTDFLTLLDSQRTQLLADDALARAEAGVNLAAVGVYKALGGAGSNPQEKSMAAFAMPSPG